MCVWCVWGCAYVCMRRPKIGGRCHLQCFPLYILRQVSSWAWNLPFQLALLVSFWWRRNFLSLPVVVWGLRQDICPLCFPVGFDCRAKTLMVEPLLKLLFWSFKYISTDTPRLGTFSLTIGKHSLLTQLIKTVMWKYYIQGAIERFLDMVWGRE